MCQKQNAGDAMHTGVFSSWIRLRQSQPRCRSRFFTRGFDAAQHGCRAASQAASTIAPCGSRPVLRL